MSEEPSRTSNEELEATLTGANEKGLRLARMGREVAAAGQAIADLAEATRGVVHIVPHPPNIEAVIDTWNLTSSQADAVFSRLDAGAIAALGVTSGSAAMYSTDFIDRPSLYAVTPVEGHALLESAITNLENVLARSVQLEKLERLMHEFGLDQAPPDRKSPIELVRTAHSAFKNPVQEGDPVSTSLIPIREAARASIERLIRLRPKQEKAGSEWAKIVSIGTQLKRDSTPSQIVATWAAQWTALLDKELSPAKQKAISREEWRNRLLRATIFLDSFLSGLDPSKLR